MINVNYQKDKNKADVNSDNRLKLKMFNL